MKLSHNDYKTKTLHAISELPESEQLVTACLEEMVEGSTNKQGEGHNG